MFTGIIERTGSITSISQRVVDKGTITEFTVNCGPDFDTKLGDSIAINGCCLTVTKIENSSLAFDVSSETLELTCFDTLQVGELINLERAMILGARLDGHMVSGHVDGTGTIASIEKKADGWDVCIALPIELGRQVIPKGSLCINGISLTVNKLEDKDSETFISLMLIPTTIAVTNFHKVQTNALVNIEVDMIGKFVARINTK